MPISVLFFIACGVLFLLQAYPPIGVYIMFSGGGFLTSLLFVGGMVSLSVEALTGRVSSWLIAIPLSYISGYYALMIVEWTRVLFVIVGLGASYPPVGFAFDPATHIIDAPASSFGVLLARYEAGSIYSGNGKRVSIGKTRTCTMISYNGNQRNDTTKPLGIRVRELGKTFCFTYEPVAPSADQIISFREDRVESPLDWPAMRIERFTAQLGGTDIGSFTEVHTKPLGLVPELGIGCGLLDYPSMWLCGASFMRGDVTFGGSTADELAKVLGLRDRAPQEIDAMTRLPDS